MRGLGRPVHIQVFVTPTCPYCPQAVRLAHQFALESDQIRGDMIEATEFPELGGGVVGLGGGATEDGPGGLRYYVAGGVVLDTEVFTAANLVERPRVMEAIVVHELAHVVGLGHVDEPMELMYGDNSGQVELGPGDREGLARVGSLPCG